VLLFLLSVGLRSNRGQQGRFTHATLQRCLCTRVSRHVPPFYDLTPPPGKGFFHFRPPPPPCYRGWRRFPPPLGSQTVSPSQHTPDPLCPPRSPTVLRQGLLEFPVLSPETLYKIFSIAARKYSLFCPEASLLSLFLVFSLLTAPTA